MSDRAPIPNLPPISSIKDPDVRVALESMWNAWRVRNGDVGDGEHKFLTAADLKDALTTTTVIRGGGGTLGSGTSTTGVAPPNTSWIKPLLDKIDDYIMQSYLWKLLGERIAEVERPEWFIERFDTTVGTAIRNEEIIRQAADSSLASSITTVSATLGNNIAQVRKTTETLVTDTSATARDVTSIQAAIGYNPDTGQSDSIAAVKKTSEASVKLGEANAKDVTNLQSAIGFDPSNNSSRSIANAQKTADTAANDVGAAAKDITRLQAAINYDPKTGTSLAIANVDKKAQAGVDAAGAAARDVTKLQVAVGYKPDGTSAALANAESALDLATTIDGQIKGAWTVKFDANGYVTGAGLSLEGKNGSYQSSFYVRADKFAIGNPQFPGVTPIIPFKVLSTPLTLPDGQVVPPGVYMNEATVYKLTGTFIDAGTLNAAEIYTGSTYLDRISKYPVPVVGLSGYNNYWIGGVATNIITDSNLRFYGPYYHYWCPFKQRVRGSQYGGNVIFNVSATANVEHYFSIHYRVNDGPWQYLFHVVENGGDGGVYGSGMGPIALSFSTQLYIDAGTFVDFGVGLYNNLGSIWTTGPNFDIRDLSIVVTTSNL